MSSMHLSTSIQITTGMTLEELQEKVDKAATLVKGSANISVSVTKADRYWESDEYSVYVIGETLE